MLDKYRVHQVAKDLGVSNKYVIDLLEKHFGEQKKHMTALTEEELNVVFENVTQNNQVKSFDNYFAQKDKKSVDVKEDKVDNKNEVKQTKNTAEQANKKPFAKNEAGEQVNKKPFVKNEAHEQVNKKPFVKNEANEQANRKPFVRNEAKVENGYRKPEEKATEHKKFEKKEQPPRKFGENKPGDRKPVSDKFNKPAFQNNNAKKPAAPAPRQNRPQQNTPNQPKPQMANAPAADAAEVKRVAMRAADINVDKYNDRYEQIVPTNLSKKDTGVKKQKFGGRPNKRNFMSKKDREAEKLRKLEVERERRKKLVVSLPEEMTVGDLALALKIQSGEIIKKLMGLGVMAGVNEVIDFDTAEIVAIELGAKVEREVVVTIEERLFDESEDETDALAERPPVVVVMGHVDHGKTSILDAIRHADVTAGEAGGITQHIGAYQVKCNDKKITFLDTPGHEAFTSMRARGAQITDIAILVVAADDGIMPQTVEAINHATAAGMPIIVAINKIDKPTANPDKVKQELTEYNLVPEEWGGDVICVPVSAKTKEGIDTLLEMVQLVSEVKELKANPDRMAKGTVIEARLDTGRGPIATVLVQNGTLKTGDVIIAGTAVGRVRVMLDDKGNKVDVAVPSTPVEITGLGEVPNAGDMLNAVEDERLAKQLVEQRKQEEKEKQFSTYQKVTLDNLFEQIEEGEMKELPIIVKADVQGSVEAVKQSLEKISNEEVRVKVIHAAVGAVSKSDVMLANASNAIIVGFNVRPDPVAKEDAEQDGVDIRLYRIIYDAIEEVTSAMKGMLTPKTREVDLGSAEVRQVYKITNVGTVSGLYVTEGKITRNALIRVVRDGIIIADDKLSSLKRFKDDAKEVAKGYECGATLEKYNDIKEGDVFEAYIIEEYTE